MNHEIEVRPEIVTSETETALQLELEETWAQPRGLPGWFANTDHKAIGLRYIVTSLVFFALAGSLALVMRLQLLRPENDVVGPDMYAQLFSTHGTAMMFLFAVPVMTAMGIYLVPLMVGTRNITFPRLNSYGYYVFLIGGIVLFTAFAFNTGPDAGWSAYVPLSGPENAPGKRIDFWAQVVTFTEIAAIVAAVVIIVTIFKQRAPGLSINRLPIFCWSMLTISFMILFAMTTIAVASFFLASDRSIGTHFFNPAEGGDVLLWQHMFWYFAHPEVYIMFLPGLAMNSHIVSTFSRRDTYGYPAIVTSQIAQGFISFGLWVHHMFTTSLPQLSQSFFTAASMVIAIPTGTQIFCWIATLWSGRPRMATPLLFVFGFVFVFVIGGLSGVMVASVPLDLQVHDTYFIVAHFHYTMIGGVVFPLIGGLYYWWPLITGRMMSERLGYVNFALLFIGVNVTFFPMHWLGLDGMTRRVYTYTRDSGWGGMNLVSSVGSWIIALGVLTLVINMLWSWRRGRVAGINPWNAGTLEWDVPTPPPSYNFSRIPVVTGRSPIWARTPQDALVEGLATDRREVLVTSVLDADPTTVHVDPGPSYAPVLAAIATGVAFVSLIFTPWGAVIGLVCLLPALAFWGWPRRRESDLGKGAS